MYFGLGGTEQVQSIEVVWPGGRKQVVQGPIRADREIEITES